MRFLSSCLISSLVLSAPAFAQDAPATQEPAASGEEGAKTAPAVPQQAAQGEGEDRPFQIRRGLFAETDVGVYFTFGGTNTNDAPNFPKKSISNIEPYLGVFFGYDIVRGQKLTFAAGLKLAAGYSGGAGRVSATQLTDGTPVGELPADFGIMQLGAGISVSYLLSDRIAIVGKADGGMSAVLPNPLIPASVAGAGGAAFGGIFGVGLGMEYFTLLNDFSVGLDVRFSMAMLSGASIPGLGITVPVKYTF
ncbi:MAG: adventurous gliding motility protein CglE [Myxococcota bacterium]